MSIREKIASLVLGESIRAIKEENLELHEVVAHRWQILIKFRDKWTADVHEKNHFRHALDAIRNQRTEKANATVKRMAAIAEDALKGQAHG